MPSKSGPGRSASATGGAGVAGVWLGWLLADRGQAERAGDLANHAEADGSLTVLHSFGGGSDGALPYAGVIADKAGNLYGTTWEGGSSNRGTVFKISTDGTETILHAFTDGSDGAGPAASLVIDGSGNLYGTTRYGGTPNLGTIFRISRRHQPICRPVRLLGRALRDGGV